METKNRIISLYTEATPNPETMKFVANVMVFARDRIDMPNREEAEKFSPLATALFDNFPTVKGVFIANNFVTVTKTPDAQWFEIIPAKREFIRNYLQEEHTVLNEEAVKAHKESIMSAPTDGGDDDAIVAKIKELLQKYVQPAVEMDGGSIVFRSFEAGKVTLAMEGSCAGCPSSTITLKHSIENLLRRMVPEVEEVVAEDVLA